MSFENLFANSPNIDFKRTEFKKLKGAETQGFRLVPLSGGKQGEGQFFC